MKKTNIPNKNEEKRDQEKANTNKELAFQIKENEKQTQELATANKELAFQNTEKAKRAQELVLANVEKTKQEIAKKGLETSNYSLKQEIIYSKSLLEAILDPLIAISPNGKITDMNEATVKITGLSRAQIIGTDFSDYFTDPKKAQEGYKLVFETGTIFNYPLSFLHKNGSVTQVLYNGSTYKDEAGNVLGVFVAARDITEQKAEELAKVNQILFAQIQEKEKWANELAITNAKLAFQNQEKEKRAQELAVANTELIYQNAEKEKRAQELAESEEKLNSIFNLANSGIVITDTNGKILASNNWWKKMIGYTDEEMNGTTNLDATYPDDVVESQKWFRNLIEGKTKKFQIDKRYIRKDKSVFWGQLSTSVIKDKNNRVMNVISVIADITERKERLNELVKLNRVYDVISQIDNLIIITDNQEELFQKVCRIAIEYGKFRMCWIGMIDVLNQVIVPKAWDGFEEGYLSKIKINIDNVPEGRGPVGKALREGKLYVSNDIANDPSMEPFRKEALERGYYSSIALPIKVQNKTIGIFTLYSDEINFFSIPKEIELLKKITENIAFSLETIRKEEEKKKSEKALVKSEVKFHTLFDTISDAVIVIRDHRFIDCNAGTLKMFGISSKEEFISKSTDSFTPHLQPDGSNSFELFDQCMKIALEKGSHHFEIINSRMNTGELFPADIMLNRMELEGKVFLQATVHDITERKKAEQKLEEQLLTLENQNKQLTDFTYIISHNLRGPLVNIGMLVDLIENTSDEIEQNDLLQKTKTVVNSINETFNELVESIQVKYDSKIKSDKIILKNTIKKILLLLDFEISSTNAKIRVDIEAAPIIYFPSKYLNSILFNLISNSLKYKSLDIKPLIKIKTEKINNKIILSISDNGLGIDLNLHKYDLFKLRKVFHKHPDARGFGLFMTKTQVESMGGRIWAESTPEVGSTFFVEFINQNI